MRSFKLWSFCQYFIKCFSRNLLGNKIYHEVICVAIMLTIHHVTAIAVSSSMAASCGTTEYMVYM